MNTSMTINATAMWLLALYRSVAEEQGADRSAAAGRHDPERHHQGVPLPRDLRLPARAVAAADHRHDRLHGHRDARSGTRSTSAATTCRRPARRRCRSSPSRCATAIAVLDAVRDSGQVAAGAIRRGGRPHLVLRQRRRAVRRGDVQDARVRRSSGTSSPRERYGVDRPEAAPVPLRRAGQLARPDRGAAGEQRPADRAGDARRDAVAGRPGPRRPAAGLERGARACRGRGTSSGRCGCSRCWPTSPTCSSTTTCSTGSVVVEAQGRRAGRRGPRRDRPGPGDGRRGRRGRVRLPEVGAGRLARRRGAAGSSPASDVVVGVNRFTDDRAEPADRPTCDAAIQAVDPDGRGGRGRGGAARGGRSATDGRRVERPRRSSGCGRGRARDRT